MFTAASPQTYGFYGFATFLLSEFTGMPTDTPPGVVDYGTCWGHLGATYGWNSVAFFTPGTNLSISVSDVLFLSSVYYF
jgi:hypothetical protein